MLGADAPRRVLDAVPRPFDPAVAGRADGAGDGSELGARHPGRSGRRPRPSRGQRRRRGASGVPLHLPRRHALRGGRDDQLRKRQRAALPERDGRHAHGRRRAGSPSRRRHLGDRRRRRRLRGRDRAHRLQLPALRDRRADRQPARRALPAGRRTKGRGMKGSTRNRLRSATLALAAGLVLVLAGTMLATIGTASGATSAAVSGAVQPSDATIAAKTFSLNAGQAGGLGVGCPEGRRAVGGGVGQSQSISPSFGYVEQSGPLSANNASGDVARNWFAAVFNNSGAGVRTYWVFALCSATSNATIQVNPFTVEPRTVNGASVDCPAGTRAVGGGLGQLDPVSPPFGWVQSSGPVDASGTTANTDSGDVAEGWYASVFNFGATARDFRVYAICADDAESDATIQATILSVAPGDVGNATVACPTGRRVVGGGVGQSVALDTPRGY